jgi:hypothetical protein
MAGIPLKSTISRSAAAAPSETNRLFEVSDGERQTLSKKDPYGELPNLAATIDARRWIGERR